MIKTINYDTEKQAVFKTNKGYLIVDSVNTLYLYNNKITKIENIPNSVKYLNLDNNKITKIENIPNSVKYLNLYNNKITKIENIPNSVKYLNLYNNKITKITKESLNIIKKNKIAVYGVDVDELEVVE